MSLINLFSEKGILPLSDLALGHSIAKYLAFLQKSQWWSKEEIENYQNEKLRELVNHSYNHVPYYKELFDRLKLRPDDIKRIDDLEKLPILTKDDIRKNASKFVSTNIPQKELIKGSSSGSTGEPLQFYRTKQAESFNKAAALRAWYWMGYRLGDKYVKISMNPRTSKIKKIQDFLNRCKYLSSTQLVGNEFIKIKEKLLQYDPKFIRCYPVPLLFLSELFNENDKSSQSSLIAINTTGSTLHDDVRQKVQNTLGANIFDSYSCEGGSICAQCESLEHYHFTEEHTISEFIEDNYTIVDPERPVRHITTDLQNYATPFIRYDSQDYVVLGSKDPCSCGRAFQNIKKIKGRDSDILITPSKKYLIVENFVAYFEWVESVDQIQVVQNAIDRISINLLVNSKFTKDVNQELIEYWTNYIGNDVNTSIEVVDEIKLTPTGKRRTLIRNPEIKIGL